MKRIFRKWTAVISCLALLLTLSAASLPAAADGVGDVDGDGKVTITDALMTLQAAAGKIRLSGTPKVNADASRNGKLEASDALLILQYVTKRITTLEPHKHTYVKYRCTGCGEVDKTHVYDYLMAWLLDNGEVDGEHINFDYVDGSSRYGLSCYYASSGDQMYFYFLDKSESYIYYVSLDIIPTLSEYRWYGIIEERATEQSIATGMGTINSATFTANTPIRCEWYEGTPEDRADFLELSRQMVLLTLDWIDWMLNAHDLGITLADLGFTAYEG